jgi:DNA-binding cell septation regulator SpoVG
MNVNITRFVRSDTEGALKAFCDVSVGDMVLIKGIRIVEGRLGPFISMPRQQNKLGKWYDSVVPLCPHVKKNIYEAVMQAYRQGWPAQR